MKKWYLSGVLLVASIALISFTVGVGDSQQEPRDPGSSKSIAVSSVSSEQTEHVEKPSPVSEQPVSQNKSPATHPPASYEDVLSDIAGFTPDVLHHSDYASYSSSTLDQLSQQGDVVAMQVLGFRLLTAREDDKQVERGKRLLHSAAVHGARHYPMQLLADEASLQLRRAAKGAIELSEEAKRKAIIETFSYYELAAMRGNRLLKQTMVSRLYESHGIGPTQHEWREIEAYAKELYAGMQDERFRKGLEPFDNSPPEEASAYYLQ